MARSVLPPLSGIVIGAALTAAMLMSSPVRACGPVVEVRFYEGGSDVFVIENRSQEAWTLMSLEIRLQGSAGRLVFDTDFGGEGFSEPQQFEPVAGEVGLMQAPVVADGAEELDLHFLNFDAGRKFTFTIDLDDRLANSAYGQAVIDGAEIEGADARAILTHQRAGKADAEGTFGSDGKARLRGATCV